MKKQFVKVEVTTDNSGFFCADQCPYSEIGWCNLLQVMFDKDLDKHYTKSKECSHRRPPECIGRTLYDVDLA